MINDRIPRAPDELQAELEVQVGFLEKSCRLFDEGDVSEAKRLAATIRTLVHDTKASKSLLGQLGLKAIVFVDTANPVNPRNLLTHSGLVAMRVSSEQVEYVAMLDGSLRGEGSDVSFEGWWKTPVVVDTRRRQLSRSDVVLAVADQDGGAHVDSALDPAYHDLSRGNSLGWEATIRGASRPLGDPTPATIRQIAHELIKAIRARRPYSTQQPQLVSLGRNDPCFCNSGRKYKRCHGGAH